jgi:hypothetical protein
MSPEEFANEFGPELAPARNAYGYPVQPVKPGLTKRGKAALAIGATVIAGGGLLAWQNHSEQAAANQVRAQELAVQQQQIELEKLKEINKATTAQQKTQETQDVERKKQIDACVQADKGLVGKQLGVTYSSVLNDCRTQFGTPGDDRSVSMQETVSASDAGSGGISPSLLLGLGVGGALVVAVAANRGKKVNAE